MANPADEAIDEIAAMCLDIYRFNDDKFNERIFEKDISRNRQAKARMKRILDNVQALNRDVYVDMHDIEPIMGHLIGQFEDEIENECENIKIDATGMIIEGTYDVLRQEGVSEDEIDYMADGIAEENIKKEWNGGEVVADEILNRNGWDLGRDLFDIVSHLVHDRGGLLYLLEDDEDEY